MIQGVRVPISSLDPFSTTGIEAFTAMSNVIEPLFRIHPSTGELIPALATKFTLQPRQKTFRVSLRKNVKFHNGDPLTAEDVKFTYEAYFKPEYQGQIWQGMWSDVEGVKVIDPLTAEFKLKTWRYPYFIGAVTSLRILPHKFYQPADKAKFRAQLIGTGPFKIRSFDANRKLELEANLDWWGTPQPKFNLSIKAVDDANLAAQMIEKNEMDFYQLEPAQAAPALKPTYYKSGLGQGFWIDLNFKNPLFGSLKVRQALLLIWNREDLNKKVFDGKMQAAVDVFSPNMAFVSESEPIKFDQKKALELLKEEGWEDRDHDGLLDKGGKALAFSILVSSSSEERWVSLYQGDAKKAGIQVKIERIGEDAQWIQRLKSGNFDAYAGSGALMNEPAKYSWATDGFYNYSKYSNKEVDELSEKLDFEFDAGKRRLIMRKLIEIIRQDLPQIPGLNSPEERYLLSSRLKPNPENPKRAWLWQLR